MDTIQKAKKKFKEKHKIIYATFPVAECGMLDEYKRKTGLKTYKNVIEYFTRKGLKEAGYDVDVI